MPRPTTKDLASHLGMSRSTVDRVLNGRPGVKEATVKAVNKAIEELGFERNIAAANLAKNRIYRFVFLLPRQPGEFLSELEAQVTLLAKGLAVENVAVSFQRVLETDPHKSVAILGKYSAKNVDGVAVLAPDSPQLRDGLARLADRGVHVVRIVSGRQDEGQSAFIGIDNRAAGRTAARLLGSFAPTSDGQVVVVTDAMTATENAERRLGFDQTLQARFPNLSALPTLETRGDKDRTREVLQTAFRNYDNVVGVYVMGSEAGFALSALDELGAFGKTSVIAHERTAISLNYLAQGKIDALIVQDPGHVVRSAVRVLRARVDNRPLLATQDAIRIEILLQENLANQHLARSDDT